MVASHPRMDNQKQKLRLDRENRYCCQEAGEGVTGTPWVPGDNCQRGIKRYRTENTNSSHLSQGRLQGAAEIPVHGELSFPPSRERRAG